MNNKFVYNYKNALARIIIINKIRVHIFINKLVYSTLKLSWSDRGSIFVNEDYVLFGYVVIEPVLISADALLFPSYGWECRLWPHSMLAMSFDNPSGSAR